MTHSAFEGMAKQHPTTSFLHAYPGIVKTGFSKEAGFAMKTAMNAAYVLLAPWKVDIQKSGERHLYATTSVAYPAKSGNEGGVDMGSEKVMKGSTGEIGSGAYLIGSDGELRANEKALKELRSKGAGQQIWDQTTHTFDTVKN